MSESQEKELHDARQRMYMYASMNTYGKTPEEQEELSRLYRNASEEFFKLRSEAEKMESYL